MSTAGVNILMLTLYMVMIVFSVKFVEYIKNLRQIFQRLGKSRVKLQLDKSKFLRKDFEFLVQLFTPEDIKPKLHKVEAMKKFPTSKTAYEIKSSLVKITKPFTNCLI